MLLRSVGVILSLLLYFPSFSQKKKSENGEAKSTTVAPYYPSKEYGPKETKGKKKKNAGLQTTYSARDDFNERMERNWKEREKREKNVSGDIDADKSQPPYFGHKRPPKKRPPGKMKFCKVCGIKH